jgi:hypothetical protein
VDWHRGPGRGQDAAAGVAQLLARAQQELGGPLLGAKFVYDARQMFAATREIERAVSAPGTTLYVGFQRAEKLDGEAPIYRNLTSQGVQVIAFGTGSPAKMAQVRWVRLPEDHGALANQWFLVTQTPEPIAFVGFETSPSDRIGEGGAADPSRTWAGFVTDDPRLVAAIASHLHGLAGRAAPPVPDGQVTAPSTMLVVATDDGTDPAYTVCRRAGLEVARREGPRWSCMTGHRSRIWSTPMSLGHRPPRTMARPAIGPWTSPSCSASAAGTWPSRSPRVERWGCRSGPGWPAGPGRQRWPPPVSASGSTGSSSPTSWPAPRCGIASWAARWPASRIGCRPRSPS